jgi:hypothetical protein
MALQALQSSGVAFRKILSHFPEELSLAFAYGSGVYRQAGPNSDQKVSPAREAGPSRCGTPASPMPGTACPQSPLVSSVPSTLQASAGRINANPTKVLLWGSVSVVK